jgi:hypothetical protein
MLQYDSASAASGWMANVTTATNGTLSLVLVRATTTPFVPNAQLCSLYFHCYLTDTLNCTLALAPAVWNAPITDSCSVLSLPDADSLNITLAPRCGDSILYHAMRREPILLDRILVEPNPAHDKLRIVVPSGEHPAIEYELFDALGASRTTGTLTSCDKQLDVRSLPAGVYYIRLSTTGTVRSKMIVIEK